MIKQSKHISNARPKHTYSYLSIVRTSLTDGIRDDNPDSKIAKIGLLTKRSAKYIEKIM